jgi:hypothetical protein
MSSVGRDEVDLNVGTDRWRLHGSALGLGEGRQFVEEVVPATGEGLSVVFLYSGSGGRTGTCV